MPNGDGWKETFKFFIKELEEVYLPNLKDLWSMVVPTSPLLGEPQEDVGEVPQPIPAPPPTAPYMPSVPYEPPLSFVAGEPPVPYDPPPELPGQTPFPPWDPQLPYGYDAGTPTPFELDPYPTPWWEGPGGIPREPDIPWWRQIPPEFFEFDYHFAQTRPPDSERKA